VDRIEAESLTELPQTTDTNFPHDAKWTQAKVIAALKSQHAQGLPWRGLSVRDPALYSAARRCFGCLPEALEAAELNNSDSETNTS
jgi:hypothetical protein